MKKTLFYSLILFSALLWIGCEEGGNYPGGTVSPYISLYDLRNLYKGSEVALTKEAMFGSSKITGVVVSDHSGGNLPEGLLILQDKRRLQQLRGISIPIGAAAASFVPGDSVIVDVEGGTLKRMNGILQITNVGANAVTKVSSGNVIPPNRVTSSAILSDPSRYESTLVAIVKGGFDPLPAPGEVFTGDKILNDGFDNITMHTESKAAFANSSLPVSANFYGIIFNSEAADGKLTPRLQIRQSTDVQVLSSTIEITPIIITGFISDVKGGDGNYEYMQFMATRDIDFAQTPFSVVVTSNAGASSPAGFPVNGWATGAGAAANTTARTFKFNLTSGTAAKGTFFYVGGSGKMINGANSTNISSLNWIRAFNYTTTNGDGFGLKNGGLFANSGNASGFAVFEGTNVTRDSKPIDVIFVGTGGSLFTPGPPAQGYKIANTDLYDVINPITLEPQPYYRQGSNTMNFAYTTADVGYFYKLGGVYNPALGRWVKARTQTSIILTKTSAVSEIEGEGATTLK
ncbi:DUF5689 domain-containing protein [Pedobacter sp. SYSU D00535]|uniref:DUF5689 domain-containing protein n=1 Tax=Pedobacter sp. SYSU D00535 TaxID=2810308 RepID=UPI001A97339D|nr:DUF5689 domain-containing protein [Pedobacter sp. SYSU D00535]